MASLEVAKVTEQDVTIHLEHERDTECDYEALTAIEVDILVRGKIVGKISGTRIERLAIPDGCFYSVMDEHSSDLQYVAVNLFEPRRGRTKLHSLRDGGDHPELAILYISRLEVNEEYTVFGSSDVGAYVLRKLLHHPYIRSNGMSQFANEWLTSSCIYILDSNTPADRSYANQFLRNGFRQDKVVVGQGGDRFRVAARTIAINLD
ncbi:unnamed protein product [Cylindrotheca closterium]|uniref:Uncharacterized protein n=1 Tax=Cylindrotheca closterium TaxID=2856 RepID=A0AAD2FIE6_9STRA|nr:unnamed protein product [Cylindrotheca closterium]